MLRLRAERWWRGEFGCQSGQAVLLLVAAMAAVLVGAVLLGGVAKGIGKGGREQRAADLGALAGARAMREAYTRLFEPPSFAGQANPRHLEVGAYKDLGRDATLGVARANGAQNIGVAFPEGGSFAPTQIRVTVRDPATSDAAGHHHEAAIKASAEAELAPPAQIGLPFGDGDGEYQGPGRGPDPDTPGLDVRGFRGGGPPAERPSSRAQATHRAPDGRGGRARAPRRPSRRHPPALADVL